MGDIQSDMDGVVIRKKMKDAIDAIGPGAAAILIVHGVGGKVDMWLTRTPPCASVHFEMTALYMLERAKRDIMEYGE